MTTATQTMIERIPLEVINNNKFELIDELATTTSSGSRASPPTRRFQADRDRAEEGLSRPAYTIDDVVDGGDQRASPDRQRHHEG